MSTSSPPAGNSMRQQLDELDALLQRMLTLPVNQLEETPEPAPTPIPAGARRPTMLLLDGSAPVPPPQSPPPDGWAPHWNIDLNPRDGSSILGPRSPAAATRQKPPVWRAETVAFAPAHAEPTPQPPLSGPVPQAYRPPLTDSAGRFEPVPMMAVSRRPVEEPIPLLVLPVIAVNRAFDAVMFCLGPPGQWFCTRAGRTLLGYAGLAMLVGSAAWLGWPR